MVRSIVLVALLATADPLFAAAPTGAAASADAEAALVCAWLFTATAERLQAEGVIGPAKRDVAVNWSARVLNRYVGGSATEQQTALAGIGVGRDTTRLVEEFAAQGNGCLTRFPI